MTKKQLEIATQATKTETKNALQLVYDTLNNGQQKKILKNEAVKKIGRAHV